MTDQLIRERFIVHGRVQGVGFRYATQQQALHLGLRGWVRNRPDGHVDVFAIGDRTSLSQFERWLHQGPRFASVEEVERLSLDASDDLRDDEASADRGSFDILS